jgi:hypothetical protein
MIPQKMLPPALRTAPVEEQLSYLLQRRDTIERLLESLERYVREKEVARPVAPPIAGRGQAELIV